MHETLTVVDVGAETVIQGPEASPHDGIVAWQPGGTGRFATHSDDVVRVWDWRRGRQVVERRLGVEITTVAYTPDGRHIIVGDGDGSVYRIDAETLLPVGARAGRRRRRRRRVGGGGQGARPGPGLIFGEGLPYRRTCPAA